MKAWHFIGRMSVAATSTIILQSVALQARADRSAGRWSHHQPALFRKLSFTAEFRERDLQDTPIAITAVTGEMLEARSQVTIADVANQAPSVTLKPNAAAYGPSLTANIRGVGQFDFHPRARARRGHLCRRRVLLHADGLDR